MTDAARKRRLKEAQVRTREKQLKKAQALGSKKHWQEVLALSREKLAMDWERAVLERGLVRALACCRGKVPPPQLKKAEFAKRFWASEHEYMKSVMTRLTLKTQKS